MTRMDSTRSPGVLSPLGRARDPWGARRSDQAGSGGPDRHFRRSLAARGTSRSRVAPAHCRTPCSAPGAAPGATEGGSDTASARATPWAAQSCHESLSELEPSGRPSRAPPATGCGHGGPGRAGGPVAPAAWQSRDWRRRPAPKRPPGACVARRRPLSVVYEYEMMPEHARWFAGSAEGLTEADAAAERLPRTEGPCGRCLGVRVRRVARKGRFAPPGLAGLLATAGRLAGS